MAYQFSKTKSTGKEESRPVVIQHSNDATKSGWRGLITVLLIVIILGGGVYFLNRYTDYGLFGKTVNLKNEYQAVFLDNGQVYFGKVVGMSDEFVTLRDIYYLQVVDQPLQRSQEVTTEETPANETDTEQRLTLFKLGNEIHGPRDEMNINRQHVVIIEDLKDDSQVVTAIKNYLVESSKPQNQQQQQPTNQAIQPAQ